MPKRVLGPGALEQLRAQELPPELQGDRPPLAPPVPMTTERMDSFWELVRQRLSDPRSPRGVRHPPPRWSASPILAIAAGCQGTHAMARFAQSLIHGQRRRLRCRPRRGSTRQFEVRCERTFIRLYKKIDPEALGSLSSDWMAGLDPQPAEVLHLDGKVLENAEPAPSRLPED